MPQDTIELDTLPTTCMSRAMKLIATTKLCAKCNTVKPLDGFGRDTRNLDGRQSWCKQCKNRIGYLRARIFHPDKYAEKRRRIESRRVRNPEQDRIRQMRYHYGITIEAFNALLKKQHGRCAICKAKAIGDSRMRRLHVDHDHKTKAVRGLLCFNCNAALGMMRDNITVVKSAWRYLQNAAR